MQETWPGIGSKPLAAKCPDRDQLGRGFCGSLHGEDPSGATRAPHHENVRVATFQSPRRLKRSESEALTHQSDGDRRAGVGSPRAQLRELRGDSETADGKASEQHQLEIFGSSRRLAHGDRARPRGHIEVSDEHGPLSPRAAPSSRRKRGASTGPKTRMHGHLNVCSDITDLGQQCQREIFGGSPRRKRSPSPRDRAMPLPAAEVPAKAKDLFRDDAQSRRVGDSPRVTARLIAFRATAAADKATDDGHMVAVFGTSRRQLSPGVLRAPPGNEGASQRDQSPPSFCWSSAPEPSDPSDGSRKQWPETRSRRILGSKGLLQDQLSGGGSLNGEYRAEGLVTQERYGNPHQTLAGAAQMDVFGSPRRQRSPSPPRNKSPIEKRGSSPAARMWRWLGAVEVA